MFLILIKSILYIVSFVACYLSVISKNLFLNKVTKIYLFFLLRVFWFGLIFRPLVHFDLCAVWGRESNFIYLFIYFECGCPTVPAPSIKEMFLFAIEWTWNSSLTLFLWKYYACLSDIPLFGVFWALFLLSFVLSYSYSWCLNFLSAWLSWLYKGIAFGTIYIYL